MTTLPPQEPVALVDLTYSSSYLEDIKSAAFDKLPKVDNDVSYLTQAMDLIQQGKALVNPLQASLTSAMSGASDLISDMSSFAPKLPDANAMTKGVQGSFGSIDDFLSSGEFEGLVGASFMPEVSDVFSGLNDMAAKGASALAISGKMFTDWDPFSDPMGIPDDLSTGSGIAVTSYAKKLGVPQVSTLVSVASSQQALEARLGNIEDPDSCCDSFSSAIGSAISSAKGALGGVSDGISSAYASVSGSIASLASSASSALSTVMASVKSQITGLINWGSDTMATIKEKINTVMGPIKSAIMSGVDAASLKMKEMFAAAGELKDGLMSKISEISNSVMGAVGDLFKAINETANAIREQVKAGFASMIKSLSSVNPCAQAAFIGPEGILSGEMKSQVLTSMPEGAIIGTSFKL